MVIGVCEKCGYQDLIDDSIDCFCLRCSGNMKSLGINSTDWNLLTSEEKQARIEQSNEPSNDLIDTATTDVSITVSPEIISYSSEVPTPTVYEEPDSQNDSDQIDNSNTLDSQINRQKPVTKKKVVTTEVKQSSIGETDIKETGMINDFKCVVASRLYAIGVISQIILTIAGVILLFLLFDDYHDRWIIAIIACVGCCLIGYINRIVCSCFAVITENQYKQLRHTERTERLEVDSVESIVERPLSFE